MEKYFLSKELIQALGNYLVGRPYSEVAQLIQKLEAELKEQENVK